MVIYLTKDNRGGVRKGAGRTPLDYEDRRKGVKIYITDEVKEEIAQYGCGNNFSQKAVELIKKEIVRRKK